MSDLAPLLGPMMHKANFALIFRPADYTRPVQNKIPEGKAMRVAAGLVVAAAVAFTMPSAWAQAKKDLGADAYRRAACECKKPKMDFSKCMERRLGYVAQAATAASVYCADTSKKKK